MDEKLETVPSADSHDDKLQLPPYPEGLFDLTDEEKEALVFKGDLSDIPLRLRFKVLNVWLAWAALRTNERLINLVNEKETTNSEDVFYLKQLLVSIVDRLGKVLSSSYITEELFPHLKKSEENKQEEDASPSVESVELH
jgi:hypothetical protein